MENTKLYLDLVDKEKNIYELATLFEQNRKDITDYFDCLASPVIRGGELVLKNNEIICKQSNNKYPVIKKIIDFTDSTNLNDNDTWNKKNREFLNYHRSLSTYTLINSSPIINYLSLHSGIGYLKNIKVIDIGGGTGHSLCSFFMYPETIDYFLVDPNYRLLHDQFLRIYPKLSYLKMAHILAYAENLPFKENIADLVISISAIDHFKDYKAFIGESYRILKTNGQIFIAGHLDIPLSGENQTGIFAKILSSSLWERISRYLYYRKYGVSKDDHIFHFNDTKLIEQSLADNGFKIIKTEFFKRYFYIVAEKI